MFINDYFQVLADGSSASLAVFIDQKYRLHCEKIILCNPIVEFLTDEDPLN